MQRRFDFFGKIVDMTLIARRSRHYAGTRYLKRGISVHGKVANDCEMEQVWPPSLCALYYLKCMLHSLTDLQILQLTDGKKSTFASHVQMRGSIPTYWYQETSVTMPKPPILVNRVDPAYLATQVWLKIMRKSGINMCYCCVYCSGSLCEHV